MALKKTSMCNSSNALLVLLFLVSSLACSVTASVSYDSKAITINGQRRILISGSIHYPRSSPEVFSQMHFMFFVLLLLLKLFLQMGTSKCAPGLCPLVLIWLGFFFVGIWQMWPDLIQKAKEGGLDVIQTYVFWNGHEPSPGKVIAKKRNNHFFFWLYLS